MAVSIHAHQEALRCSVLRSKVRVLNHSDHGIFGDACGDAAPQDKAIDETLNSLTQELV